MGQKLATDTSSWSTNDWAFGTAENAVQVDEVVDEVKQMPMKYFGGNAIQKDASMQQMQNDLLSFDNQVKRLFFWRKKNKRPKKGNYAQEEYQEENEQNYDQSHQTIPEEDEPLPPFPPLYVNRNDQSTNNHSLWKCRNCGTQNQSMAINCEGCKQPASKF